MAPSDLQAFIAKSRKGNGDGSGQTCRAVIRIYWPRLRKGFVAYIIKGAGVAQAPRSTAGPGGNGYEPLLKRRRDVFKLAKMGSRRLQEDVE